MDATAAGIPLSAAAGSHVPEPRSPKEQKISPSQQQLNAKPNQVGTVMLYGIPIVSLVIENQERLCLAQISNTLLKEFSYNEIHNRRVALGITCVQCTPVQLEILRRAGAMPVSSRRCGMITRREAERLCKSFLGDNTPPRLPEDFAFSVHHECAWGCRGAFLPARYNSSRAKCIKCSYCGLFFSPNKFIFHSHRTGPTAKYVQPDAANFNSWRRHMKLSGSPPEEVVHAWEDVKAMFNGGTRKRLLASAAVVQNHQNPSTSSSAATPSVSSGPSPAKLPKLSQDHHHHPLHHAATSATSLPSITPFSASSPPAPHPAPPTPRVPPFSDLPVLPLSRSLVMDYVWHHSSAAAAAGSIKHHQFPFPPYAAAAALPWLATAAAAKRGNPFIGFGPGSVVEEAGLQLGAAGADSKLYPSAFRPVYPVLAPTALPPAATSLPQRPDLGTSSDNEEVGSAEPDADQEEEEETVDIETTEEDGPPAPAAITPRPSPARNESPTCWTPIVPRKDQELSNEESPATDDAATSVEEKSEPSQPQESERLWAVARLSLERQDRVLYRQEVARHLHIMRGAQGALSKMALDCSTCHQLYSGAAVLPTDTKISP